MSTIVICNTRSMGNETVTYLKYDSLLLHIFVYFLDTKRNYTLFAWAMMYLQVFQTYML